jgi:YggT family protein
MTVLGLILYFALMAFLGLLFVRLVVDWVQVFARDWHPTGVVLIVLEVVYSITDPPIKLIRRYVPPLRLGGLALDTSFLIVFVACWVLVRLVAVFLLS